MYKAIGFLGMLASLERMLQDPAEFSQLVTKLSPETQRYVRIPPRDNEWMPLRCSQDLIETAHLHAFHEDFEKTFELGRQSQRHGINLLFRFFILVLKPNHVLSLVSSIWGSYYRGNGTAALRQTEADGSRMVGAAELTLRDVAIASPRYWQMIRGTLYAFGEATRVDDLAVTIVAGGGDENHCTYRITWR